MTNTERAEQDTTRAAYLAELGVTMTNVFVPQSASRNRDDENKTLNWVCTIARAGKGAPYRVDYEQGLAYVPGYVHQFGRRTTDEAMLHEAQEKAAESGKYPTAKPFAARWPALKPLPGPALDDVLSSLLSDAQAGEESFEDFCGEMGFDEDSRKAEAVWRACGDVARKLSRLFTHAELERLRELFSDY